MFRIRFKMPQKKDPLIKILPVVRGRYLQNISLARHTWFGVGGNAEIMYIPEDAGDLAHFLRNKPHNVPVCLIGGGSNLLVRDGGVPGVGARATEYGEEKLAAALGVGLPTLKDMLSELQKPGRDPREALPAPVLRTDVLDIKDLQPGMELTGTVRNVIDFGAFVDIGVHQDGLVHISRLADRFVRHPSEVVKVGDVVKVWVVDVDEKKKRIALTMVKGRA